MIKGFTKSDVSVWFSLQLPKVQTKPDFTDSVTVSKCWSSLQAADTYSQA